MAGSETIAMDEEPQPVELTIDYEKLGFIIIKAREFDAKVDPVEANPGSNPTNDDQREILEDYADDPTYVELVEAIEGLNEDGLIELVALVWLGRGDYEAAEWSEAMEAAREAHNERTADYLVGTPNLGDELDEGLAKLGLSIADVEGSHL
jgi:hypothetical protein